MKKIKANRLNPVSMSVDEKLPQLVIDDGILKRYVGIGWVDERMATPDDYKKYPTVKRS